MAWVFLVFAILAEIAGTTSMKLAEGFSRLLPSVLVVVFYGLSLGLLTLTLRSMDVSVAYAVWSGMGVALISAVGILCFGEPATAIKISSLILIIVGVVGLNLGGAH